MCRNVLRFGIRAAVSYGALQRTGSSAGRRGRFVDGDAIGAAVRCAEDLALEPQFRGASVYLRREETLVCRVRVEPEPEVEYMI